MQARAGAAHATCLAPHHLVGQKMPRDSEATPEWHRARAKDLRRNGFTKMAEQHEQIARTMERERREQQQTK